MLLNRRNITLTLFFLIYSFASAQDDKNNLRISISIGIITPKYFLNLEDNQNYIKSSNMINNSSIYFDFNIKIKKQIFYIEYCNLKRNFIVKYNESDNKINTYNKKSILSSFSLGHNYLIYQKKFLNLNLVNSIIYTGGYYQGGNITSYNVLTNQSNESDYTPHHSLNKNSLSLSIGFNLEKNIYKNNIISKTQILFAKNISKEPMANGVDRLLFSSSLSFTIFKKN